MIYRYILILFSLTICFPIFSQVSTDLAKKAEKIFPDDNLVLTGSSINITFKTTKKDQLVAIAEYTDSFISLNNQQSFPYALFYDEFSSIKSFNTGVQVEDTYYQSEDIFHSDTRMKYSVLDLKGYGRVKQVSAKKQFNDLRYLTNFYLTQIHPCLYREINVEVPRGMDIEILGFHLEENNVEYKTSQGKNGTVHSYVVRNIPSYSNESGLPGNSHIYPHILVLTKSYSVGSTRKKLFNTTADQYKWYRSLVTKIDNQNKQLKSLVTELTKDAQSDKEKLENIFYWVQDHIRYIAFEDGIAGFKPEACQKVFADKYGDCKGMANLMKEMLILAGFDARLCWIGTKSILYDYSIPSLAVDNHMICALKYKGTYIYLDATEKFINIDSYAERIQGQDALIEDGERYIIEKVPITNAEKNKQIFDLDLEINEKELTGKLAAKFNGESKSSIRYSMSNTKSEKLEDAAQSYLAYGQSNVLINDVQIENFNQKSKESNIFGNIKLSEFISKFGSEVYVYLDPYKLYNKSSIKKERKHDYWFPYKINEEVNVDLKVPSGYAINSLPEALNIENEEFKIKGNYVQENNVIKYRFSISLLKAKISKKNISEWNQANSKLDNFYDQPIIISKQ